MSDFNISVLGLRDILEVAQALLAKKSINPLTDNVEISVNGDSLEVKATDGVSYITLKHEGVFTSFSPILINPTPLLGILKTLDPKKILNITPTISEIKIDLGGKKPYTLRATSGSVAIPTLIQQDIVHSSFSLLGNMKMIEPALDKEKQYVVMKMSKGLLSISATNGYKLAKLSQKVNSDHSLSIVLDKTILSLVSQLEPTSLSIDKGNRLVKFESSKGSLVTKQILDPVPDIDIIVSNTPENEIKLETENIIKVIKRLQALGDDLILKVSIQSNSITLTAEEVSIGSGEEETLTASTNNKGITFFIKASYFLQALQNFESVALRYSNNVSPIFITGQNLIYVIMPVRM